MSQNRAFSLVPQEDLAAGGVDGDGAVAMDGTVQDGLRQEVHQLALHQPLDRSMLK